jgi:hypothetical protein
MERQSFVYESLRMLCATPEFGDQLFSMLTPLDICAILHVFDVHITQKQIRTYMQVWRQFFIHKDWATQLISHGFEVSLVGNDLITLIAWMNNPSLMNIGRTPSLYLDLRIVSPVASRRFRFRLLKISNTFSKRNKDTLPTPPTSPVLRIR